ncbi:MAG TPA: N-acetylmuramoyl-L-alanine amidase [Nitratifractor sp.]|nr:N-acetylmuramoyl-L-alanine amidase [Nitratifractor sp.]
MASRVLFILILLLLTLNSSAFGASVNQLLKMKVKNNSLELHFSKLLKKSDIRTEVISGKKITKYIFDFKNCYLSRGVKSIHNENKVVSSIRVGQYKGSVVRLVLDSKRPFSLKYYQKKQPIFFIKLPLKHQADSVVRRSSLKELFSSVDRSSATRKQKTLKPLAINNPSKSIALKHNYKIVIDPGHGGRDPGTLWHGVKEKSVVLQISKRVYRKLKTLGFKVLLTRNRDKTIAKLGSRIRFANRNKGDLYVSIHANSIPNKKRANIVHGVETYFLMPARDKRAKRVAARENRQLLQGEDIATKRMFINVVFTGPKIELSKRLAIDVQRNIIKSLRGSYDYIRDGGARGAPYYVLVGAQMPAVLVETGYLSNPKERKRLLDPNYQDKLSDGIVNGIISYFKNRERELD